MLPPPLRPLVPLSAVALLGWCWYNFRRQRRNLGEQVKKEETTLSDDVQNLKEGLVEQKAATDGSRPSPLDLKPHCHLDAEEKQGQEDTSAYSDQNLNLEVSVCSPICSSTMDKLPEISPTLTISSSPTLRLLKGDRPEPEGEISEAQASALLDENLEMETEKDSIASKGHPEFTDGESNPSWPDSDANSLVQQPPKIVWPKEDGLPSLPKNQSDKEMERVSSILVREAIRAATEEVLATDAVSSEKDQEEPKETLLSEIQTAPQGLRYISKGKSSLLPVKEGKADRSSVPEHLKNDVFTEAVEESVPTADDLNDQCMSPSVFHTGEDSGCSTCHSEDGTGAEEASTKGFSEELYPPVSATSECKTQILHDMDRRNEELPRQKTDVSEGTNDVPCMNGESRLDSRQTAQFPNSALTLWDIEVPSVIGAPGKPKGQCERENRLVGRLIGKQGRHVGFLKQNSGAMIYVSTLPYTHEFQICHIEGSQVQVENALALIRKKFKDLDLSNRRYRVQPAALPSLPITSWLLLPQDGTAEVIVPRVEAANYLFVQQHTHPSFFALRALNEQMLYCYSRPGCPSLPTPVEAGVVCVAPSADGGGWWRAQVIQHFKDSDMVQIRYVDYGGYVTVNLTALRQIRSDFVALPFQGSEVMLERIAPLPGKEEFSLEAKEALEELTQGVPLIIKVTGSQSGLPLVHMWRQAGEEMISVNELLVERRLCSWLDSH